WRSLWSRVFSFLHTVVTRFYTPSLHDALPISERLPEVAEGTGEVQAAEGIDDKRGPGDLPARPLRFDLQRTELRPRLDRRGEERSEEHTSEFQSRENLVCRLLLE